MNQIAYNIDCMEYMRTLPDKAFDLAIVDPPYGIGCMSMNYTKSGAIRTHGYAAAERRDYRKQQNWDIKPNKTYFDELFRISEHQIIWGVIIFQICCRLQNLSLYGIKDATMQ